jgi:hypothetical protein
VATPKRDNERAAWLLVEAMLHGDVKTAAQHKITRQTLHNYRKALTEDAELLRLFTQYSSELTKRTWADKLDLTLQMALDMLLEHIQGLEDKTPASVSAITEALKVLSETAITREVLRAGDGE